MNREEMMKHWAGGIGGATEQQVEKAAANSQRSTAAGMSLRFAPSAETSQKTVLLVDSNDHTRKLRAKVMQTMRVRMDCVADTDAARTRLAKEKYNLILVDPGREIELAEELVREIRSRDSRQLVRFLVGSPMFLAKNLSGSDLHPAAAGAGLMPETPADAGVGAVEDQAGEDKAQ